MASTQTIGPSDDGSTQPLETQVYRDYYLNVERASAHEDDGGQSLEPVKLSAEAPHHAGTPRHLLLSDPRGDVGPDLSDDDPIRAPNVSTFPTSHNADTPLPSSRKRDRSGNVIRSRADSATPSQQKPFSVAFGQSAAPALTQLFEHTQADVSSPFDSDEPLPDPAFERPSPKEALALPETSSSPRSRSYRTAPQVALEPGTHYEPIYSHSGGGANSSDPLSPPIWLNEQCGKANRAFWAHDSQNAKRRRKVSANERDLSDAHNGGIDLDTHSMLLGFMPNAALPYTPGRTAQTPIVLSSDRRRPMIHAKAERKLFKGPSSSSPIDHPKEQMSGCAGSEEAILSGQPLLNHVSPIVTSPSAEAFVERKSAVTQKLVGSTQTALYPNDNAQTMAPVPRSRHVSTLIPHSSPARRRAKNKHIIPETSPPETGSTVAQWNDDGTLKKGFYTPLSALPGTQASRILDNDFAGCGSDQGESALPLSDTMASTVRAQLSPHKPWSAASVASLKRRNYKSVQLDRHEVVMATNPSSMRIDERPKSFSRSSPSAGTPFHHSAMQHEDQDNPIESTQLRISKTLNFNGLQGHENNYQNSAERRLSGRLSRDQSSQRQPCSARQTASLPSPCQCASSASPRLRESRSSSAHSSGSRHNCSVTHLTSQAGDTSSCLVAPFRVWACFKGFTRAPTFYPASCISSEPRRKHTFRVHFDDGTDASVEDHLLTPLDLREGDLIKVDRQGLRNSVFAIQSLKDRIASPEKIRSSICDIHGHQVLSLSLRGACGDKTELLDVSVSEIYVTSTMWRPFEKRANAQGQQIFRAQKQTQLQASPQPMTQVTKEPLLVHGCAALQKGRLFTNMVFAVSFSATGDSMRQSVTSAARASGAQMLDSGFEELFGRHPEQPGDDCGSAHRIARMTPLQISKKSAEIGFVALISDTHLRTAKYLQALALNIPCLSGRWIVDCVKADNLLPWRRYLLPAGESVVLDGAIRSRVLLGELSRDCSSLSFKLLVEHRPRVLDAAHVLIVAGKGKKAEDQETLIFLAHAMGASSVRGATSVDEAEKMLEPSIAFELIVCVDNSMIPEARKRFSLGKRHLLPKFGIDAVTPRQGRRVFPKEALMQSLILGELYTM